MTSAPLPLELDPGDAMPDLTARRPEVVRRLLDRGVSARALRALLPAWEPVIDQAVSQGR